MICAIRRSPAHRTRWRCTTALVWALAAAPAGAVQAQTPNTTARDVLALTAKVERIDTFSRSLTVRTADGQVHSAYVGRELKVFDELRTGDTVRIRIVESVVVAARPGAKLTAPLDTTAAGKKEPGAEQADVLQQIKAVVRIESIDPRTNVITYLTGDNRRVTRAVADPKLLEGLSAGDVIEVTYTRERAIELEKEQ